ncbi:hypothetical protein BDW68DRAFT_152884 [Aspergillus falconensis]
MPESIPPFAHENFVNRNCLSNGNKKQHFSEKPQASPALRSLFNGLMVANKLNICLSRPACRGVFRPCSLHVPFKAYQPEMFWRRLNKGNGRLKVDKKQNRTEGIQRTSVGPMTRANANAQPKYRPLKEQTGSRPRSTDPREKWHQRQGHAAKAARSLIVYRKRNTQQDMKTLRRNRKTLGTV